MAIASISRILKKYHTLAGGPYSSLSRQRVPQLLSSSYSDYASTLSSAPQPSSAFSFQHQEQGRGRSTWSKWLLFLPGAITFGLGTWQIFRSMQSPVLVNKGWVPHSWRENSFEVSRGSEQPSNIAPSSVQQIEQSSWRRFWSKKPKIDQVPAIAPTEVVGVVRGSEKLSIFVPANDSSSCWWFYVDVPTIARAAGLPETTVYIEDINENINPSNPYPVPKDVNTLIRSSVMPQDHLNYTLTCYIHGFQETEA